MTEQHSRRLRDRYGRPVRTPGEAANLESPDTFVGTTAELIHRGITLYNKQRFFEAHEFFEAVWKADDVDDADRPFWKAVTQVAVGCCHVQRGNTRGAVALLQRGAAGLRQFPSPHLGIDSAVLIGSAETITDMVQRIGASPEIDFPPF